MSQLFQQFNHIFSQCMYILNLIGLGCLFMLMGCVNSSLPPSSGSIEVSSIHSSKHNSDRQITGEITKRTDEGEEGEEGEIEVIWGTPWGELSCLFSSSSFEDPQTQVMIKKQNLKILKVQARMWIEVDFPPLKKHQLYTEADPNQLKAGDWILYTPPNGVQESLILEKPIPWIGDHAKRIGYCPPSPALFGLTRVEVMARGVPAEPLNLTLISIQPLTSVHERH